MFALCFLSLFDILRIFLKYFNAIGFFLLTPEPDAWCFLPLFYSPGASTTTEWKSKLAFLWIFSIDVGLIFCSRFWMHVDSFIFFFLKKIPICSFVVYPFTSLFEPSAWLPRYAFFFTVPHQRWHRPLLSPLKGPWAWGQTAPSCLPGPTTWWEWVLSEEELGRLVPTRSLPPSICRGDFQKKWPPPSCSPSWSHDAKI